MNTLVTTDAFQAPTAAPRGEVTQLRVVKSEWIKLRTLRSTYATLVVTVVVMVGLGALVCWAQAGHWPSMPADEKAHFDAVGWSLVGFLFAQLALGVLGVLSFSGEYSTGMVRATFAAVPRRLPVLWAKAAVFGAVALAVSTVAALASFFAGQQMLSAQHIQASLTAAGVPRMVLGAALYLTLIGLFGVALGALTRSTPGGLSSLLGVVLVLPQVVKGLPTSWFDAVSPYLPNNAGAALFMEHRPQMLAPWTGFGLLVAYVVMTFTAAAVLLKRRDA